MNLYTITLTYPQFPPLASAPYSVVGPLADTGAPATWEEFAATYLTPLLTNPEVPPFFRKYVIRAANALRDLGEIGPVDRIELGDGAWVKCEAAGGSEI